MFGARLHFRKRESVKEKEFKTEFVILEERVIS